MKQEIKKVKRKANKKIPKNNTTKPKFKKNKQEVQYEALSVTTLLGEKTPLIEALNSCEHEFTSFAQLNRAALNLLLKKMGSDFRLTEKS